MLFVSAIKYLQRNITELKKVTVAAAGKNKYCATFLIEVWCFFKFFFQNPKFWTGYG